MPDQPWPVMYLPLTWLVEHDLYICHYCVQLDSNTGLSTHYKKCAQRAAAHKTHPHTHTHTSSWSTSWSSTPPPLTWTKPYMKRCAFLTSIEMCHLEDAWLQTGNNISEIWNMQSQIAFHVPKMCSSITWVPPGTSWQQASPSEWFVQRVDRQWPGFTPDRAISHIHQSISSIRQRTNNIDMDISLGRSGMFGKACRILQ